MARFMLRSAVYILLIKENKILLTRRKDTEYYDGFYNFPSGHLDGNESVIEALKREAKEEIDIKINKEDVELVHTLHRRVNLKDTKIEYIDLFFRVKKWSNEPKNCEIDKCDKLAWFNLKKLPDRMIPYQKEVIEAIINKSTYGETGF